MAASPTLSLDGADKNITIIKAKSLAVRTNSIASTRNEQRPKTDKGPEFAEQLNEETKHKYVKGKYIELPM